MPPKKGSLISSFQAAVDEAKALLAPPPVKKSNSTSSAKSEAGSTRASTVNAESDGDSHATCSPEEAELLAKLGVMLEGMGGSVQMLEGWRASSQRRKIAGAPSYSNRDVLYVAPDGTQHRSNVSVARHFGLAPSAVLEASAQGGGAHGTVVAEPRREKSDRAAAQVADTAWNAQKWNRVRIKCGALTTCGIKSDEEVARSRRAAAAVAADPRRITFGNSGGNRGRLSGGSTKRRKGPRSLSAADRSPLNNTDALAIEEHGFAECRGLLSPELCEKLSKEPMVRARAPLPPPHAAFPVRLALAWHP